jgi:ABC-2 type transport system permease protein
MPGWLRATAKLNPLTYQVDALRTLMVQGGQTLFGLSTDAAVQVAVLVVFVLLTARLYPNVVR